MFGRAVELTPGYDLWWSYIPHFIHSPFYVYAYAFGELLTLALYERYKQGQPDFVERYLELLGAGAAMSPEESVAPLGIDLSKRSFWQGGIAVIERMVQEVERSARK
jgi:oligoendopeptidase F